jgi:hypothetical protein
MENYEFELYQESYPVTSFIIPIIKRDEIILNLSSFTLIYKRLEFVNNTDSVVFKQSEVCNLFNINEEVIRIQFLKLYKSYSIHTKNYEIWITKLKD